MMAEIDETKCPLCGEDNNCMNLKIRCDLKSDCWCASEDMSFPSELIEKVPEDAKLKACICQSCVKAFNTIDKQY